MDQLGAELSFKGGDLLADRRLTDTAFFRNAEKLPLFSYPDENCIASNLSTPVSLLLYE